MFEEEVENLKELVYSLEDELQEGEEAEAIATLDMISGLSYFLRTKLIE